jgi:hypothetical protein
MFYVNRFLLITDGVTVVTECKCRRIGAENSEAALFDVSRSQFVVRMRESNCRVSLWPPPVKVIWNGCTRVRDIGNEILTWLILFKNANFRNKRVF